MKMKKMIVLPFIMLLQVLAAYTPAYGAEITGRVTENTLGGEGISLVQVWVVGENPVPTDTTGRFVLEVPDSKPGEVVKLGVNKTGMEVVNDVALEVTLRRDSQNHIEIVMCKKGQRAVYALLYFRIQLREELDEIYAAKLKALEKTYANDRKTLQEKVAKLTRDNKAAQLMSDKLAKQLAEKDKDEVSGLYKKALELMRRRELDNADKLLDEEKMAAEARRAKKKIQQEKKKLRELADSYILKAQIASVRLEFSNADNYYRLAVDMDRGYFWSAAYYADFLYSQNRYKEALPLYKQALSLAGNSDERCAALNDLGNLYYSTSRLSDAEGCYQEALKIYKELAAANPAAYQSYVATSLNNLGTLYSDTSRLSDAEGCYQEALKIYKELAAANPAAYQSDVAGTLNNLGLLYKATSRLSDAEGCYQEALKIRRELAAANPAAYQSDVAMSLNNLGLLYKATSRLSDAEGCYQEALKIRREIAASNPAAYQSDVAGTLNNLGLLYKATSRLSDAEGCYQEALKIRRELAAANPAAYQSDVATSLNNLGLLYKATSRLSDAEGCYQEALNIRRELAAANPAAYQSDVATSLNNLGLLYVSQKKYSTAEDHFKQALEIREKLAEQNPGAYELDLADTLISIVFASLLNSKNATNQQNMAKMEKMRIRAISILQKYPHVPSALAKLKMLMKWRNRENPVKKNKKRK
jgi:tetratricopeptide (TPR) repeat protein